MLAPIAAVDAYMERCLAALDWPGNLVEAIRYAALSGGKRMRPILVIRACEAVGGDSESEATLAPAAAIEFIHCFSLVHDDLPAMDDDDLRRGRPTLHKKTNDAMAILAGDAMMGLAFELLATRIDDAAMSAALTRELALGTNGMIAGQVYDTLPDFPADVDPLERLRTIHRHKTGALIRAAVRMGAVAGGASENDLDSITQYGDTIGLMFQVVDDLLDVTATTEQLGKTAGKDVQQDKTTYPAVLGLEATRAEVQRLTEAAHSAIDPLGDSARHLRILCDYLAVRTK